jgi:glycosyltransferase involved in cell wall biosynthesis
LRELAASEGLWLEFFPPHDSHAFANGLVRLMMDSQLRDEMRAHNREAVSKLNLREIVGEYLQIFAQTASHSSRRTSLQLESKIESTTNSRLPECG